LIFGITQSGIAIVWKSSATRLGAAAKRRRNTRDAKTLFMVDLGFEADGGARSIDDHSTPVASTEVRGTS
jgi:hypothetical protein